jgi:hypothetical protein
MRPHFQDLLPIEGVTGEDEKPPFQTTTLWDYPTQSHGKKPKGNNKFQGVTPAFVIKFNFFLKGFKYLVIVRKPEEDVRSPGKPAKVRWQR